MQTYPIETAPRDGSRIIVWVNGQAHYARWDDGYSVNGLGGRWLSDDGFSYWGIEATEWSKPAEVPEGRREGRDPALMSPVVTVTVRNYEPGRRYTTQTFTVSAETWLDTVGAPNAVMLELRKMMEGAVKRAMAAHETAKARERDANGG